MLFVLVCPNPPEPDPGLEVAKFLGWFVMLGGLAEYRECKRKAQLLAGMDIDEILGKHPDKLITRKRSKKGETKDYMLFTDSDAADWADLWARFHNVNRGHHRHYV